MKHKKLFFLNGLLLFLIGVVSLSGQSSATLHNGSISVHQITGSLKSSGVNPSKTGGVAISSYTVVPKGITINGTNQTAQFEVSASNLLPDEPINLTVSPGFTVSPTSIAYNAQAVNVTVTLSSTKASTKGELILRSGDTRVYINLMGYGTPLEEKDLSASPKFTGTGDSYEITKDNGFTPTNKGYTIEFKAKADDVSSEMTPYAVVNNGLGFQSYTARTDLGIYNSSSKISRNSFYYTDKAHTYRYAVTQDNRVFVYKDGVGIDTIRAIDNALPSSFAVETGDPSENLLKNPGFEGEVDRDNPSDMSSRATGIEGWNVYPMDQYNSNAYVTKSAIDDTYDLNNHVMSVERYKWSDGWSAAEISQIVDVAPSSAYTLKALAKGGIKSDGTQLGAIKIQELQDKTLGASQAITSDDYQTYAINYTTSAACTQVRVLFYLERDKWGASISQLVADNVVFSGDSRLHAQKIGFTKTNAALSYFTYDITGAYAPLKPKIQVSTDASNVAPKNISIKGTNQTAQFQVSASNLLPDEPINLTVPPGFTVSPSSIAYNAQNVPVTVTLISTKTSAKGELILRSGDTRVYINLMGYGTPLEEKDLSASPKFTGTGDSYELTKDNGFTPTNKGYTLEFKVKADDVSSEMAPYAVVYNGVGFQSSVGRTDLGIYNSINKIGRNTFYYTDKAHTYRYSVTQDNHVFVYKDGVGIDTIRAIDNALPSSFAIETGDPSENLLKNPGFEGEVDRDNPSDMSSRATGIEGWNVYPLDQWNSNAYVTKSAIDDTYDLNNHVLNVERYMWSDGWGAAEISQIVDVAPSSAYTLKTLAKGGIKSDGTQLGAIKIQEVQNNTLGASQVITSADFQTYALNYTTSAACTQVRVLFYLERDKWGASISQLVADNVVFSGDSRLYAQKIGFTKTNAALSYFTYDITGAYAPLKAGIQVPMDTLTTAVAKITKASNSLDAITEYISGNVLYLNNVPDNTNVNVYLVSGQLYYSITNYKKGEGIPLKARGVYVLKMECDKSIQTMKVLF